ncbi:unnamed protein product [Plasmodium vivax]|uniref:(malaria parasite P. vivax) hypothetical protein n=1 Tax=Plasmodium vivax TaxID=5855 RepID=A0A8S4H6I3_PLAVI|nr:unnamed protein product [Plasmodium vivax]
MKLNYLGDNVNIISEILMKKSDQKFCYAKRFAQECKNIYKHMNTTYCSDNKDKEVENIRTCSELSTFEYTYTNYLFKLGDIKKYIPSLTTGHTEQLVSCESDKGSHEDPEHAGSLTNQDNNASGLKPITAPTVIGTMAGIPPFLALMYKFTPAGRWISSSLRGGGRRINNSLYGAEENGLLLEGPVNEDLISYNIGYEAAYDP